ncbi:MAG: hypothetical protein MJZ30_07365 [Paludibacteraceae bacterium]|nr:hypothetical protein [Paludibacteraceae bacterium]
MKITQISLRVKGAPSVSDVDKFTEQIKTLFRDTFKMEVEPTFSLFSCYQCSKHKTVAGGKVVCKDDALSEFGVQPIEAAQSCENPLLISPLKLKK